MNKKSFFINLLFFILMFSLTSLASNYSENITRYYADIKIKLNGQEIIARDESGTIVEPFIVNGTTYLPVRAIANALNLDVSFDSTTNTVLLNSKTEIQPIVSNNNVELENAYIVSKKTNLPIRNPKTLEVGDKLNLAVIYFPENANDVTLSWKSSNSKVARINSSGVVTCLSKGMTTITVTANNNVSDSFELKVEKAEEEEIAYSNSTSNTPETSNTLVSNTNNTVSTPTNTENANIEKYKKYVTGLIQSEMASRGVLDSTMTTSAINRALEDVDSDAIVYITNTGNKYHTFSCQYLYNSVSAIRKDKAIINGYLPCAICKPYQH